MGKYIPCSNCSIAEEITEGISYSADACDGCFYNTWGCTEEEFYECEEDNSPSECKDCSFDSCEWRSFASGHKCAY